MASARDTWHPQGTRGIHQEGAAARPSLPLTVTPSTAAALTTYRWDPARPRVRSRQGPPSREDDTPADGNGPWPSNAMDHRRASAALDPPTSGSSHPCCPPCLLTQRSVDRHRAPQGVFWSFQMCTLTLSVEPSSLCTRVLVRKHLLSSPLADPHLVRAAQGSTSQLQSYSLASSTTTRPTPPRCPRLPSRASSRCRQSSASSPSSTSSSGAARTSRT